MRQRSTASPAQPPAAGHRTRLILKDGSYQIVMSYQVKGKIVSYFSAERDADGADTHGPGRLGRDAQMGAAASGYG